MFFELAPAHRELIERVRLLSRDKFASRASEHDRRAEFPRDCFDDLFAAGVYAPTVPVQFGGLGIGPPNGTSFVLWMMTRELARADLSLARCWEGHVNSLALLTGMADEEQKRRWFQGVVEGGDTWAAWSGEPLAPKPGEELRFGTETQRVDGGFVVNGSKVFCTSASGARRAILLVNLAGKGGARHSDSPESLVLLACDLEDPSVSVDSSWWDPIGMRATASHLVKFDQTFIPDSEQIGYVGQYLEQGWQTLFVPHYAASFLGAAEGAYDYALEHVGHQKKERDPYVQHRVARMRINLDTGLLWLRHVADLWKANRREEAQLAASQARYKVEHLAEDTVREAIRACGARCLIRPSAIERIYRDLSFYIRHDSDDQVLASVGKSLLGLAHDLSFHKV